MIAAGSVLRFTVSGTVKERFFAFTQAQLRDDVAAQLARFVDLVGLELGDRTDNTWTTETWPYYALVTVRTRVDHADARDVLLIVDHAFFEASGTDPVTTPGHDTQQRPDISGAGPGLAAMLTAGAVLVVGAIVLVIWARP